MGSLQSATASVRPSGDACDVAHRPGLEAHAGAHRPAVGRGEGLDLSREVGEDDVVVGRHGHRRLRASAGVDHAGLRAGDVPEHELLGAGSPEASRSPSGLNERLSPTTSGTPPSRPTRCNVRGVVQRDRVGVAADREQDRSS